MLTERSVQSVCELASSVSVETGVQNPRGTSESSVAESSTSALSIK